METSTPPSPPIASPKAVATAATIMSFFKKLANEFEKLDFGSDDKDKRKNESQSQGSRGKKCPHPHPRCASRWSHPVPVPVTELPLIAPNGSNCERRNRAHVSFRRLAFLWPVIAETIMLTPTHRLPPATIRPPAAAVRRRPQPSAATGVRRLLSSGLCRPPALGPGLPAPRRQAPAPGRVGPAVGRAVPALVLRRAGHRPHPMGGSRI